MIKVSFKRTGTDHETDYAVDLNDLPETEAQNLLRLIEEADFFDLPENLGTASLLDEPQYLITIEYGKDEHHTVGVNDAAVPESLRPLVTKLIALANAQTT